MDISGAPAMFEFSSSEYFTALQDLQVRILGTESVDDARRGVYFVSNAPNFPSVDAFMFVKIGGALGSEPNAPTESRTILVMFQVTLEREHPVNLKGMSDIYQWLPANARKEAILIFVLPERMRYTSPQRYEKVNKLKAIDDAWPDGKIYQFSLTLSDDEICRSG